MALTAIVLTAMALIAMGWIKTTSQKKKKMNIENYKKVLEQIKAHPETWNQTAWHCSTAHCFGGHAQILSGCKIDNSTVRRNARIWLDISFYEADYLFDTRRKIEDFEAVLKNGFYSCDGFNRDGFNRNGYDRKGFNRNEFNCNGYDRYNHDRDGFDRNGFDYDNLNKNNQPKKETK